MHRRIRLILKTISAASVGGCVGNAIYVCWHNANHVEQYVTQSAPWYTSILVSALVSACIVIAAFLFYIILGIHEKNSVHRKEDSNGKA